MVFLEVEMQRNILIPPDQLVWVVILRLMSISTTKKASNEHAFFVAVTSLNKIGEERIWDLTGDILFPVTFKCTLLIMIREDPRPYWYIMSNNVLMCIENRADLPYFWTEVLIPQVVANWINWSFHIYLNEYGKDAGTTDCKKKEQSTSLRVYHVACG